MHVGVHSLEHVQWRAALRRRRAPRDSACGGVDGHHGNGMRRAMPRDGGVVAPHDQAGVARSVVRAHRHETSIHSGYAWATVRRGDARGIGWDDVGVRGGARERGVRPSVVAKEAAHRHESASVCHLERQQRCQLTCSEDGAEGVVVEHAPRAVPRHARDERAAPREGAPRKRVVRTHSPLPADAPRDACVVKDALGDTLDCTLHRSFPIGVIVRMDTAHADLARVDPQNGGEPAGAVRRDGSWTARPHVVRHEADLTNTRHCQAGNEMPRMSRGPPRARGDAMGKGAEKGKSMRCRVARLQRKDGSDDTGGLRWGDNAVCEPVRRTEREPFEVPLPVEQVGA